MSALSEPSPPPVGKSCWVPHRDRVWLPPVTPPASPPGRYLQPKHVYSPVICWALAVWVVVIYVSGMVGIGGILGHDRGREQSCLSGLVITLGLGE